MKSESRNLEANHEGFLGSSSLQIECNLMQTLIIMIMNQDAKKFDDVDRIKQTEIN